jgi:hypothetical protein
MQAPGHAADSVGPGPGPAGHRPGPGQCGCIGWCQPQRQCLWHRQCGRGTATASEGRPPGASRVRVLPSLQACFRFLKVASESGSPTRTAGAVTLLPECPASAVAVVRPGPGLRLPAPLGVTPSRCPLSLCSRRAGWTRSQASG